MPTDKSPLDARMHMQLDLAMRRSMLERERVLASAHLVADMALSRHILRGQVCNAVFEVWPWHPCSACCQMLRDMDVLDSMLEVCSGSRELFRDFCKAQVSNSPVLIGYNTMGRGG